MAIDSKQVLPTIFQGAVPKPCQVKPIEANLNNIFLSIYWPVLGNVL